MNDLVVKVLKSSLFSSIGLAILGLLLFFESENTIVSISYIIGGILMMIGVVAFINYIKGLHQDTKNELNIVYGVGMIILGIIVINSPKTLASIIPFVLGVVITLNSAAKLEYSLELKRARNELWIFTLIISFVMMLFGITLIFNPFRSAEFISKIVGTILFVYAVIDVISTLKIKNKVKDFEHVLSEHSFTIQEADVIEDRTSEDRKKKNK